MASPRCPSFSSSSEKPEKSRENSELPSDLLLSEDDFSNEFRNLNDDTGFQTAPSSPPHTSVSADSSLPAKESTTDISSLPLPKLLQQPNMVPSPTLFQGRDAVPSHHLLKVKSFSSFSKAPIEKYCSEFEAGGYKWNLSIYPTGDKSKDGEGHISIYLEIVDTSSLPAGWEVNAIFNFFLFDQFRDKYVGPQDATVRRFHCLKTQWGIVKFMDLETFNNPPNGYLVNDTCSFGVEVFIVKTTSKAECLSMLNNPSTYKISWKIPNVSRRKSGELDCFIAGDYKWRVIFYPNGYQAEQGKINNNVFVALELDSLLPAGNKLFVRYTFRVMDQKKDNHVERSGSNRTSSAFGFRDFMSQAKFKDPENGYLVDDACIIEVEFEVLGLVTVE